MKQLLFICLSLFTTYNTVAQTEFELDTQQSMLMTGKGPGQDGTINPYDGQDCYAIVENIGDKEFYIRVQKNGEIQKTWTVAKGEIKKVLLLKGNNLYLDPNQKSNTKARVSYQEIR